MIYDNLLLAFGSIVLAEVIRDFYHLAGHYWEPLQNWHTLHHKAYRPDLSMVSLEAYCKAQLYNDVPEATCMTVLTGLVALLSHNNYLWLGCLYSFSFLVTAGARSSARAIALSQGWWLKTDYTHEPGELLVPPSQWKVNRTYHWRHHFDRGNAYFCGSLTLVDKVLGTSLSLQGKVVAVTGASGALGQALIKELGAKGARVVALTTSNNWQLDSPAEVVQWNLGAEAELSARMKKIDILIINHGINDRGDRSPEAIQTAFEVNTFSAWRLMELFLNSVQSSSDRALKEIWLTTSEAEVNPAFSPLYELSKRTLGDLITLRRLDAPCVIRKLILGPFKSQLNPIGIMSPNWVAWAIVALAQRDFRDIIVTINPLTYLAFPIKEWGRSLYFRLFSGSTKKPEIVNEQLKSQQISR